MPRAAKKPGKPAYTLEPWSRVHQDGVWKIEAYSMATGKREAIAEIRQSAGFCAEDIAEFIVATVNNLEKERQLIGEMIAALELCLECEGITWEAEHDAEIALRHARAANAN